MKLEEAMHKTRKLARGQRWPMEEPLFAWVERRFILFGKATIHVTSRPSSNGVAVRASFAFATGMLEQATRTMAQDEAIGRAREIARERGWPWEGPACTFSEQRVAGRRVCVMSNAWRPGMHVLVRFRAETGELVSAEYVDAPLTAMTPGEALERAREIARERDWTWCEPAVVWRHGSNLRVRTNADSRGCHVWVDFHAKTGSFEDAGVALRRKKRGGGSDSGGRGGTGSVFAAACATSS
jgi:hypothetical protein